MGELEVVGSHFGDWCQLLWEGEEKAKTRTMRCGAEGEDRSSESMKNVYAKVRKRKGEE